MSEPNDLYDAADQELIAAKRNGRNQVTVRGGSES